MSDPRAALRKLWKLPRGERLPLDREWIYFLEAASLPIPLVKIGNTKELKWRVITVQCGCPVPLKLIGAITGPAGLEKVLHAKFETIRYFGEWFVLNESLRGFIAGLPKGEMAPLADVARWVSETGVALTPETKPKPRSVMTRQERMAYDMSVFYGKWE